MGSCAVPRCGGSTRDGATLCYRHWSALNEAARRELTTAWRDRKAGRCSDARWVRAVYAAVRRARAADGERQVELDLKARAAGEGR